MKLSTGLVRPHFRRSEASKHLKRALNTNPTFFETPCCCSLTSDLWPFKQRFKLFITLMLSFWVFVRYRGTYTIRMSCSVCCISWWAGTWWWRPAASPGSGRGRGRATVPGWTRRSSSSPWSWTRPPRSSSLWRLGQSWDSAELWSLQLSSSSSPLWRRFSDKAADKTSPKCHRANPLEIKRSYWIGY